MFWAVAIGLAGVTAALIVLALLRRGTTGRDANPDVQVYRDQLSEVERDLARGTLSAEEAGRVRIEVSRRLLDADRQATARTGATEAPGGATRVIAGLSVAVILGGALGLYWKLGAPGYPDLPLQTRIAMAERAKAVRPPQAEAEAQVAAMGLRAAPEPDPQYAALMDRLRSALADRPGDLEGYRLLARNEAALGNYAAAARAQARVIEIRGDAADAADWGDRAEYLLQAAGGYVSPEAETALTRALQKDPDDSRARYFAGLLHVQTGRPDLAFRLWSGLLEAGPESAPWIGPIRAQMPELAQRAGVAYDPPARRGPSAADVAAAEDMSPEDRDAMIGNMVAGLSDRLATEGGPPEDWARLIAAYGVLGETDRARAIWTEARQVFAGSDAALATIAAAARRAGLTR